MKTVVPGEQVSAVPYLAESLAYGREKTAYYSTDDWVLILPESDREEPLLYDLGTDPGERANLYRERPERAAELERRLEAFVQRFERRSGAAHEMDAETLSELQALGYGGGD